MICRLRLTRQSWLAEVHKQTTQSPDLDGRFAPPIRKLSVLFLGPDFLMLQSIVIFVSPQLLPAVNLEAHHRGVWDVNTALQRPLLPERRWGNPNTSVPQLSNPERASCLHKRLQPSRSKTTKGFLPKWFPLTLKTYSRACGCPNKVVYGFSMMLSGESPSMLFDLGLTRFEANYNPHLIYDASCLAKEYRYNRELEGSCLSPSPPTEGYICDATCSSDASIATTFISKIWVQICWQICSTK